MLGKGQGMPPVDAEGSFRLVPPLTPARRFAFVTVLPTAMQLLGTSTHRELGGLKSVFSIT